MGPVELGSRTPENVLAVRVEVDEETDASGVPERVRVGPQTRILGRVPSGLALEHLRARVRGRPAGDIPLERPVAIDIATDAGVPADALTVLPPQPVGGLCVDEP